MKLLRIRSTMAIFAAVAALFAAMSASIGSTVDALEHLNISIAVASATMAKTACEPEAHCCFLRCDNGFPWKETQSCFEMNFTRLIIAKGRNCVKQGREHHSERDNAFPTPRQKKTRRIARLSHNFPLTFYNICYRCMP